jgi:HPt (histidine-containing phosphotransfer) domain-containing protein
MRIENTPSNNTFSNIPDHPAIDIEILQQLRLMLGVDTPHVMAGLIENYLEHAPRLLKELRQCTDCKDKLGQVAHTFKCRSLTFGATKLCSMCEELRNNGISGNEVSQKIEQIENEYDRVKLVLEAEWHRLYEIRLKTDVFFPTGSYKNIGFYPK